MGEIFYLESMVETTLIGIIGIMVWSRFIELLVIRVISDCLFILILYWMFVDQEQAYLIRKGKDQVLRVPSLFRGRWWLWLYDCVMHVCLASLWYMYVCRCCIIDHTWCKWGYMIVECHWIMARFVWLWECTCVCDCGLLNGSVATF